MTTRADDGSVTVHVFDETETRIYDVHTAMTERDLAVQYVRELIDDEEEVM